MDVDGYSLWINGGSLLFIAPEVTEAERIAVLDSLLFAQLRATKRVGPRFTQPEKWYRNYKDVLSSEAGWLLTQVRHASVSPKNTQALAPMSLLKLNLAECRPRSSSVLASCIKRFQEAHNLFGLDLLTQHAISPGESKVAHVSVELVVVHPGLVLDLARISFDTSHAPGRRWLVDPLASGDLRANIQIEGLCAEPDHSIFEVRAKSLVELMSRKRKELLFTAQVVSLEGELSHD